MRKIFTFLFAALMSVGMYATTVTWDNSTLSSIYLHGGDSFTKDGVTLTVLDGMIDGGNFMGFSNDASFKFSTSLENFTKIEITGNINALGGSGWTQTILGAVWTGEANETTFGMSFDNVSQIVFTIADPAPEPEEAIVYDVAQAIAAADASSIAIDSTIIVRGVISKIEIKGKNFAKYGSACIYVADATGAEGEFEFYNCFSLLADTFRTSVPAYDATSTTWAQLDALTDGNGVTVHVGDTVIAEGKYNKYYNTYQLNQGCYLTDIMPFVVERELTKVGFHFPELNQPADNNIEMVGSFEEGTMNMEKIIATGWFLTYSFIHAAEEETFKFRDKTNTDMVLCKKVGDNWVQAIFTFGDLWAADTWLGEACMLIELDIHDSELYAWMEGMPEPEPEVTAVENVAVAEKVVKIVRNGQVLIIRDGKFFNLQGVQVK